MISFDAAAAVHLGAEDALRLDLPTGWSQGRTVYGGLITAAAVHACALRSPGSTPRTVTARLLEPVSPGGAEVAVEVLRAGRNVRSVAARVVQQGRLCAVVDVVFGGARASGIALPGLSAPTEAAPGEGRALPYVPGVVPEFTQNMELTWLTGGLPFSGEGVAELTGWCRHRTTASGVGALLGLLDAWPAPVLSMASRPFPASTVQWTAHFDAPEGVDGTAWHLFSAAGVTAGDGYATTQGHLWDAQGRHVAWLEQLVAVFDKRGR